MILTNELLEEKYKTQQKINRQSNNDLQEYINNIHKIVIDLEKKKKVKFKIRELSLKK